MYDQCSPSSLIHPELVAHMQLPLLPLPSPHHLDMAGSTRQCTHYVEVTINHGSIQIQTELFVNPIVERIPVLLGADVSQHLRLASSGQIFNKPTDPLQSSDTDIDFFLSEDKVDIYHPPAIHAYTTEHICSAREANQALPHLPTSLPHSTVNIPLRDDWNRWWRDSTSRYSDLEKEQWQLRFEDMKARDYIEPCLNPRVLSSHITAAKHDEFGNVTGIRFAFDGSCIKKNTDSNDCINNIPTNDSIINDISGSTFYWKIDIDDAYFALPLDEEDRWKTAFRGPDNLYYQYTRAVYGLPTSGTVMQTTMSRLIQASNMTGKIPQSYIDDVAKGDMTAAASAENLRRFIVTCTEHGIRINFTKTRHSLSQTSVIGTVVSATHTQAHPSKVELIKNWPTPTSADSLATFLGLLVWLHKSIPSLADISQPLNKLARVKNFQRHWNEEANHAFLQAKSIVAEQLLRWVPDPSLSFTLATDASIYGLGGVLYQRDKNNNPRIIDIVSKTLNPGQRNYPPVQRELLSILFCCKRFRKYVHGRRFIIETDASALVKLNDPDGGTATRRMIEDWAIQLLPYNYEVRHIPGVLNVFPDALSRMVRDIQLHQYQPPDSSDMTLLNKYTHRSAKQKAASTSKRATAIAAAKLHHAKNAARRAQVIASRLLSSNHSPPPAALIATSTRHLQPQSIPLNTSPHLSHTSHSNPITPTTSTQIANTRRARFLASTILPSRRHRRPIALISSTPTPPTPLHPVLAIAAPPPSDLPCNNSLPLNPLHPINAALNAIKPKHHIPHGPPPRPPPPASFNPEPQQQQQPLPDPPESAPSHPEPSQPHQPPPGPPESITIALNSIKLVDSQPITYADIVRSIKNDGNKKCPTTAAEKKTIIEGEHAKGHFGAQAIRDAVKRAGYYWPSLYTDCTSLVNQCYPCMMHNAGKRNFHLNSTTPHLSTRDSVAMDLAVMPQSAEDNFNNILITVDRATHFVHLTNLHTKSASEVHAAVTNYIGAFGPPRHIQTDRGSEFLNKILQSSFQQLGINYRPSTSNHHESNGAAENMVKLVKQMLLKMLKDIRQWPLLIPQIMYYLNRRTIQPHNASPAQMMFGLHHNELTDYTNWNPSILDDELFAKVMSHIHTFNNQAMLNRQPHLQANHSARATRLDKSRGIIRSPSTLKVGSWAWLRRSESDDHRFGSPLYTGPYQIREINANFDCVLANRDGSIHKELLNTIRLKPSTENWEPTINDRIFEVLAITDHSVQPDGTHYHVRWKNHDGVDTWEHSKNLSNCSKLIRDYHDSIANGMVPAHRNNQPHLHIHRKLPLPAIGEFLAIRVNSPATWSLCKVTQTDTSKQTFNVHYYFPYHSKYYPLYMNSSDSTDQSICKSNRPSAKFLEKWDVPSTANDISPATILVNKIQLNRQQSISSNVLSSIIHLAHDKSSLP